MAGTGGRVSFLSRLFFPPRCASCGQVLQWRAPHERVARGSAIEDALCKPCKEAWRAAEGEECGICACRVRDCLCMPHSLKAARMHALFKLVYYFPHRREKTQNRVLYHIKEVGESRAPAFLAERLAPGIAETLRLEGISLGSCVLTYLPRTARAVREKGFDQAKHLSRELSLVLGVPAYPLLRRKRGANRVQKKLSAQERIENAKQSFCPTESFDCKGLTVLLVDDMVTTGAGMAACTRILYGVGARRVLGVTVAVDEDARDVSVTGLIKRDAHGA